jgi:carboxyl-terminal processing protease
MRRGAARQAGIKADDIILQVNGKDTKGVAVPKVVEWLRDEEGTKVTLTVKQPGPAEPRTYTLTRAVVPFDSLAGHQRLPEDEWNYRPDPDAPVAYVRLSSLRISTLQELRQLEPRLRAEGFRGLVLDLRFSSGDGLLRNAALFADGLLDGGLMWATLTSKEQTRTEFRADRECLFRDWPLAVLINETLDRQHALVAAALQDNGRAVLVGEPTKNDYYVNSVVALPDGKRGIIFRTGILERAAKERGWPVKPDHVVAMDAKAKETLAEWQRKQEIADKRTEGKAPPDPQLAKAVELIRDALKTAETGKKP